MLNIKVTLLLNRLKWKCLWYAPAQLIKNTMPFISFKYKIYLYKGMLFEAMAQRLTGSATVVSSIPIHYNGLFSFTHSVNKTKRIELSHSASMYRKLGGECLNISIRGILGSLCLPCYILLCYIHREVM